MPPTNPKLIVKKNNINRTNNTTIQDDRLNNPSTKSESKLSPIQTNLVTLTMMTGHYRPEKDCTQAYLSPAYLIPFKIK